MNAAWKRFGTLIARIEAKQLKEQEKRGDMPNPDALTTPAPALEIIAPAQRGGPRTEDGKAITRFNARTHGVLSEVMPPQDAEAYAEHAENILEHYHPVGYLEERLAERIATALWRLQRLERYEGAVIARDTANAVNNLSRKPTDLERTLRELSGDPDPGTPKALEDMLSDLSDARIGLEVMQRGPEGAALEPGPRLLTWTYEFRGFSDRTSPKLLRVDRDIERALAREGFEGEWTEADEVWTFDLACFAITGFMKCSRWASAKPKPVREDWAWYQGFLERRVLTLEREALEGQRLETHAVALAGVPHPDTVDKLTRYEAHISRQLYKAMHELEAMQDKRNGRAAPLARLEVHGMPED